jgi:hypothetical protein
MIFVSHASVDPDIGVPDPPEFSGKLIAGWDTWDSGATPNASVTADGITASAVTTSEGINWHTSDERGASADGDWGTFSGPPSADTSVADTNNQNLELSNATTGGTITFTVTNNGSSDIDLDGFHFDSYAFRPNAARTYELSVASGDITNGVIYTSADDEIPHVAGAWDNNAHDDISHSLSELADFTLEAGGRADFMLSFSGGAGDGSGGHDLWIDNVAITAVSESGDFDANGIYECADIDALVSAISSGSGDVQFDMNGDGNVDSADLVVWRAVAGSVLTASGNPIQEGDADLNGVVDVSDFNAWNSAKFTSTVEWCSGDFNADGVVDVADFNIWNENKFTSADTATVPEPNTMILFAFGILVVVRGNSGRRRLR